MKTKSTSTKIGLIVTALVLLSGLDSWARPPRAREVCGVVQKIDRETNRLTVLSEKKGEPLNVVWKPDTKFIHNWKFAPASELKPGKHATVYYRTPFFGKPSVTKIVWINGA